MAAWLIPPDPYVEPPLTPSPFVFIKKKKGGHMGKTRCTIVGLYEGMLETCVNQFKADFGTPCVLRRYNRDLIFGFVSPIWVANAISQDYRIMQVYTDKDGIFTIIMEYTGAV